MHSAKESGRENLPKLVGFGHFLRILLGQEANKTERFSKLLGGVEGRGSVAMIPLPCAQPTSTFPGLVLMPLKEIFHLNLEFSITASNCLETQEAPQRKQNVHGFQAGTLVCQMIPSARACWHCSSERKRMFWQKPPVLQNRGRPKTKTGTLLWFSHLP